MGKVSIKLTVYFEEPFWVGVFERIEDGELSVSKVTFGTFHAVFFTILKYAYNFKSSNIVTDEQKYRFMREILSNYNLEYNDENEKE